MRKRVETTINGRQHALEVEPRKTLLAVLRDQLQLTGTKEGCSTGDCGACTVLLDGEPVNACLVLAVEADGREVTTIEGIAANGELHPVQQALVEKGGMQCGFCTPGVAVSAVALLKNNPKPQPAEIRQALAGNLCRCTGYTKIVEAVQAAAHQLRQNARKSAPRKRRS
jgi:carbon-monoxide dehydrogenase small subunit